MKTLSTFRKQVGTFVLNKFLTPPNEGSPRLNRIRGDYGHSFYYEELFSGDGADIPAAIQICRENPGSVMDLGGGAGRLSIALAEKGIPVMLVDTSGTMLEFARQRRSKLSQKIQNLLTISPQDMTNLKLDEKYKNIFSVNNVLEHLFSDDLLIAALRNVNRHLDKDGHYYLDVHFPLYFTRDPLWKTSSWRYIQDTRVDGRRFRVWSRTIPTESNLDVVCDHAITENLLSFKLLRTKLRIQSYEKWISLFEIAGFRVLETWGSWKKEPISPLLPKLVFKLGK